MTNEYILKQVIIENSVAKIWDLARLEWKLADIEKSKDPETCSCSHFPIIELCWITNKINNKTLLVGNCCVNKFFDIDSGLMFDSIKKVLTDNKKSFNPTIINFYYELGIINEWELKFYIDIWRKRILTNKQKEYKLKINKKIIRSLKHGKHF